MTGRRQDGILRHVTTTVSSKGRIVLPAEIRHQDDIEPGQEFEIERLDRGEYRLKRKTRLRNEGLVKLLLAPPHSSSPLITKAGSGRWIGPRPPTTSRRHHDLSR